MTNRLDVDDFYESFCKRNTYDKTEPADSVIYTRHKSKYRWVSFRVARTGCAKQKLLSRPSIPVDFADNHRRLLPAFNHVTSVRHSDNPIKVTRCAGRDIRTAWDSKFHRDRSSLITPPYTTARAYAADYRQTMYLSSYIREPGFGRRSKEMAYIKSDQAFTVIC